MSRRRAPALAAALVAVTACAPNRRIAFEGSLAEARRAYHDGRFGVAASSFEQAATTAKLPRDAVYARYEAALAWARAGDVARAASELRAIATEKPSSAYAAQAALRAAELAESSDKAAGLRDMEAVISNFPESGAGDVALDHVVREADGSGPERGLAFLEWIAPRVEGKKVEEKVSYERAKHLDALGRAEAARDAYLDVARRWPYPFGNYNDDALFRAAEMDEKLGRPREAITLLERLLSQRETSSFMGSYERPRYLPAILRVAQIYEAIGDRANARATLHRLYTDFTTSIVRDDALWREAELWRKDGNASTACDRLSTLAEDFPDSRYVPCVAARCPSVKRPAKSRAPMTCHAYLVRDARLGSDAGSPAKEGSRDARPERHD